MVEQGQKMLETAAQQLISTADESREDGLPIKLAVQRMKEASRENRRIKPDTTPVGTVIEFINSLLGKITQSKAKNALLEGLGIPTNQSSSQKSSSIVEKYGLV